MAGDERRVRCGGPSIVVGGDRGIAKVACAREENFCGIPCACCPLASIWSESCSFGGKLCTTTRVSSCVTPRSCAARRDKGLWCDLVEAGEGAERSRSAEEKCRVDRPMGGEYRREGTGRGA